MHMFWRVKKIHRNLESHRELGELMMMTTMMMMARKCWDHKPNHKEEVRKWWNFRI